MHTPTTLSQSEQYAMFMGFLKAMETISPKPRDATDEAMMEAIMSSLNTRIVQMIYPECDWDKEKLYKIQEEMHNLSIPDRVISFMEEIYERMPKQRANLNPETIMNAFFPRKEDNLK